MPEIPFTIIANSQGTTLTIIDDGIETLTPAHPNFRRIVGLLLQQDHPKIVAVGAQVKALLAEKLDDNACARTPHGDGVNWPYFGECLLDEQAEAETDDDHGHSFVDGRVVINHNGAITVDDEIRQDNLADLIVTLAGDDALLAAEAMAQLMINIDDLDDSHAVGDTNDLLTWIISTKASVTTQGQLVSTVYTVAHPGTGQDGLSMENHTDGTVVIPVGGNPNGAAAVNNGMVVVDVGDIVEIPNSYAGSDALLVSAVRVIEARGRYAAGVDVIDTRPLYENDGSELNIVDVECGGTVVDTAHMS